MLRVICYLFLPFIISIKSCNAQLCDVFAVKDIPIYFYPIAQEVNTTKLNDSISYSIEKKQNEIFIVKKHLLNKIVETKVYRYKGNKRLDSFRTRKRVADSVIFINEKVEVCLLE